MSDASQDIAEEAAAAQAEVTSVASEAVAAIAEAAEEIKADDDQAKEIAEAIVEASAHVNADQRYNKLEEDLQKCQGDLNEALNSLATLATEVTELRASTETLKILLTPPPSPPATTPEPEPTPPNDVGPGDPARMDQAQEPPPPAKAPNRKRWI